VTSGASARRNFGGSFSHESPQRDDLRNPARMDTSIRCRRESCISIYTKIYLIDTAINDDGLNDCAVRYDRLLQFVERRTTVGPFVLATRD
jgi:hypothetical protein